MPLIMAINGSNSIESRIVTSRYIEGLASGCRVVLGYFVPLFMSMFSVK